MYVHERLAGAPGAEASKLPPGVHKVSSLAKRWLLGTRQGAIEEADLFGYLNEFVFRFNRWLTQPRARLLPRARACRRSQPGCATET